ncbi:zinc finger protein ZFPM2b isoform X1 [Pygocentrus nattereri]|uniref:Zinc finger protein, FOG family member 2b n=1 Tax=Pygocentrus nattereri TaxID=42514 RepID=A0A3B4DG36_PYGNA|nr:zinc finger protein ZFPM2b isoform X1 [Pygocentrus nattereri]
MSRRKQSKPRQFKRAFGSVQMECEDGVCEEILKEAEPHVEETHTPFSLDPQNLSGKDEDFSKKGDACGGQEAGQEDGEERARSSPPESVDWDGPRELEAVSDGGEKSIRSRQPLPPGTTWGPFPGKIETAAGGNDAMPLVVSGGPRWLGEMTWVSAEDSKNNCMVYSKGGQIWCSTTRRVMEGEELAACAVDFCPQFQTAGSAPHGQGMYPARLLDGIQLLPQQAAMASILPNAIVNKDIFLCKACGIWFRSERNLQAHLMYYCSGRQRDPELVAEKPTNTGHQMPRICTYPQCNMSFSGSHALEMHLSTHTVLKTEETPAGSSLKCTICDFTADTLVALQPHILSHLSQSGLRCGHCHFTFQTPRELSKHQELHRHGSKLAQESETEPSKSLSADCPKHGTRDSSRKDAVESPACREVLQSTEQENGEQGQSVAKAEVNSGNRVSFSYTRVKSEPSSPRLASSPIQHHMTPAFPMPPFMPHVPFSQEITAVPQASEILAKMSELVHRRLRHGGNTYPPVMYSTLVPKGATCFECNITFTNLDNYLVHKKHYCNSRWQHMAKPHDYTSILDKAADPLSPKTGGSLANMLNAGHPSEVKGPDSTQFNPCDAFSTGGKAAEEFQVQVKKALTPSGAEERHNGMQLDSKSPKTSPTENEVDPSQTTCDACKITFSRQETYMVHKQYYCATRHDPPMKRANSNKSPANQKSMRARKRRKAYEMPVHDQEQVQPMGPPSYLGMPTISSAFMSQDVMESFKDQIHQRYSIIQGLVPKHPEPSLTVTKSALVSKCNAIAQEEGDAPIDLSKKCMGQFGKMSLPVKALMDYHECAVCKISFNKVEDYLTHKQNFCPDTALDNKSPSIKKEGSRNANGATEKSCFEHPVQNASMVPVHAVTTSDVGTSPEVHPISIKEESSLRSLESYSSAAKKMRPDEQIWPYYEIKPTDYATGMLGTQSERRQSPNEGSEGEKDQPMPDGSHISAEGGEENLKITAMGQTLTLNDTLQPEEKPADPEKEPTPDIHLSSSSPDAEGSAKADESMSASSPTSKTEEIPLSIKKGLNGSMSTTANVKYCRPCDIQFNNLSNFITHKKFYCSAHTTEHVK